MQGKWTCSEIVLWSKSNLCCQDISSSVHRNQQLKLEPLADTLHESATAVQSRRNPEALPIDLSLRMWQEAAGISRGVLWQVTLYEVMTSEDQQRPAKCCKVNQCKGLLSLSVGLYLYSFKTSCTLSLVPAKDHMLYHVSASAKHPFTRQLPEKRYVTQLSFQRNQKSPLRNVLPHALNWRQEDPHPLPC